MMPYELGKTAACPVSKPFAVLKNGGGLVPGGCHATREGALRHLRALMANVPDAAAFSAGETMVFERDGKVYLVGPVSPIRPSATEVEEFAFAEALRAEAPNEHLMWLRGQYVEAERANANGHLWTADDLAIASLTPRLMPVTVMHDPSTAVGMIADAKLLLRERDGVPRSRIDTTLGLWRHRFPEVCEEAAHNYEQGLLMQSMECVPGWYECTECGRSFVKLPRNAERASWCSHLKASAAAAANGEPVRRLRDSTFTGTGLIFGSRGARGAFDEAHLEVFQEEIAEFHQRAQNDRASRPRRTRHMEIDDSRYQELIAAESRVADLEKRVSDLQEQAEKVPGLESKIEETEAAKVAAEQERDDLRAKVERADEDKRRAQLSKDRLGKLGKGFLARLGDFTRGRLEEQAGALSDEEWEARVKELEETAQVKRDEGGTSGEGEGDTFEREETARAQLGGGSTSGGGSQPSPERRRSVVAGLVR
jgi:hypothetical protein